MSHRPKIRRDDMVKVMSGKDKGKTGRVLRVEPKKNRLFVEGMNIQKRHQRPRTLRDTQRQGEAAGGVIEKEGPIHISNVMVLDPKSGDPKRVGIKREDGRRVRVTRKSGEELQYPWLLTLQPARASRTATRATSGRASCSSSSTRP